MFQVYGVLAESLCTWADFEAQQREIWVIVKNRNVSSDQAWSFISLLWGWYLLMPGCRPFLCFPSPCLKFLFWSCIRSRRGDGWHFFELSSTMPPLWSPATMTFSWSFSQRGLLLYLLSYRRITGCGSPPLLPQSLPLRGCGHWALALITLVT